jgi:hypothetical protein
MLWSPTIGAALIAGTPWLDVFCPAARAGNVPVVPGIGADAELGLPALAAGPRRRFEASPAEFGSEARDHRAEKR